MWAYWSGVLSPPLRPAAFQPAGSARLLCVCVLGCGVCSVRAPVHTGFARFFVSLFFSVFPPSLCSSSTRSRTCLVPLTVPRPVPAPRFTCAFRVSNFFKNSRFALPNSQRQAAAHFSKKKKKKSHQPQWRGHGGSHGGDRARRRGGGGGRWDPGGAHLGGAHPLWTTHCVV